MIKRIAALCLPLLLAPMASTAGEAFIDQITAQAPLAWVASGSNVGEIRQEGASSAHQVQTGANTGTIVQYGSNRAEQVQVGANAAYLYQSGSGNVADQYQSGVRNQASLYQYGAGNISFQHQDGFDNLSTVYQFGSDNFSETRQTGARNRIRTEQTGGERLTVEQVGSDNAFGSRASRGAPGARVLMRGSGMEINIVQRRAGS